MYFQIPKDFERILNSLFPTEENDVLINSIRKIFKILLVYKVMHIQCHLQFNFVKPVRAGLINLRYTLFLYEPVNFAEAHCS